jgi:thiol-disulfide isomerase/thioredoxin
MMASHLELLLALMLVSPLWGQQADNSMKEEPVTRNLPIAHYPFGDTDAGLILGDAAARAASQHKVIFLDFDASWCEPCHQMNKFLDAPEIRSVFDKYFVMVKLVVLEEVEKTKRSRPNTPGGAEFLVKFHGANDKGVVDSIPFIVLLDASGEPIVNSKPLNKKGEEGTNIGYPSDPKEIHWFMDMLQKAVPMMTVEESDTIRKWLNKHGDKYHPA